LVRIVFLGPLRDLAGSDSLEVPGPLDWLGLLDAVGSQMRDAIVSDSVRVACAGRMLADKRTLRVADGDEVALLPPVSGG
jgi:molybdopterin synthase sulfur carrier subunit